MFIGAFAINPINGERIPIFIADYVLMGYGTGAIMAVPAHDERDFEFAREFELPIVPVIRPTDEWLAERRRRARPTRRTWPEAYVGDGVAMNSANDEVSLDGLRVDDAKRVIVEWLERDGLGRADGHLQAARLAVQPAALLGRAVPDRLRRRPVRSRCPESMLPVELPEITDFEPATSDDPDALPRAAARARGRLGRGRARPRRARSGRATAPGRTAYLRETNTMPQWAGSCWYYLRYLDPTNEDALVDPAVEREWAAGHARRRLAEGRLVDLYVGGVEHAVLHLLYARFWHKVLFDLGHVSTPEPFQRLVNQGYDPRRRVHRRARHVRRGRRRSRSATARTSSRASRSRASSARWARA